MRIVGDDEARLAVRALDEGARLTSPPMRSRVPAGGRLSTTSLGVRKNTMFSRNAKSTSASARPSAARAPKMRSRVAYPCKSWRPSAGHGVAFCASPSSCARASTRAASGGFAASARRASASAAEAFSRSPSTA